MAHVDMACSYEQTPKGQYLTTILDYVHQLTHVMEGPI